MDIGIGGLSERTGVKVPTIRYYEQIGLLSEPVRTEGKQRRYGVSEVKRLNFIRHARELGFEVEDIRQLLDLTAQPQESCHEADSIARHHLHEIDRRIRHLDALRKELTRMVSECGHGRICECRIIEVIADHAQCLHDHAPDAGSPVPAAISSVSGSSGRKAAGAPKNRTAAPA